MEPNASDGDEPTGSTPATPPPVLRPPAPIPAPEPEPEPERTPTPRIIPPPPAPTGAPTPPPPPPPAPEPSPPPVHSGWGAPAPTPDEPAAPEPTAPEPSPAFGSIDEPAGPGSQEPALPPAPSAPPPPPPPARLPATHASADTVERTLGSPLVVPRPVPGVPMPPPPVQPSSGGPGDVDGRPRNRKGPVILVLAVVGIAALIVGLIAANSDDEAAGPTTTLVRERATTSSTRPTTTTTSADTATTLTTAATPTKFGDDPSLDELYTRCGAADYEACDDLYRSSAAGTEYRSYADTCGKRNDPSGFCSEIYSTTATTKVVTGAPDKFGDDAHLDGLYTACGNGDMASCDKLYYESGNGTEYEAYGDTCGQRNDPSGLCTELYPS